MKRWFIMVLLGFGLLVACQEAPITNNYYSSSSSSGSGGNNGSSSSSSSGGVSGLPAGYSLPTSTAAGSCKVGFDVYDFGTQDSDSILLDGNNEFFQYENMEFEIGYWVDTPNTWVAADSYEVGIHRENIQTVVDFGAQVSYKDSYGIPSEISGEGGLRAELFDDPQLDYETSATVEVLGNEDGLFWGSFEAMLVNNYHNGEALLPGDPNNKWVEISNGKFVCVTE
jgi:hypothetical protein